MTFTAEERRLLALSDRAETGKGPCQMHVRQVHPAHTGKHKRRKGRATA